MIVVFTGHRPNKLGGYDDKKNFRRIFDEIVGALCVEYQTIISGMALGIDTWAAELAIKLDIPFKAYVPFRNQECMWPKESQSRYAFLLHKAQEIKYICSPGYAAWKMQKRNEAMVNDCDLLIAIWDGTSGGTGNCVRYAQSINKKIMRINPTEYKY